MGSFFAKLLILAFAGGVMVGNYDNFEEFYRHMMEATQQVTTGADMWTLKQMLDLHCMRTGRHPTQRGFEAWVSASFVQSHVRDNMRDAWGGCFAYRVAADGKSFELISVGPDGVTGTNDDLTSSGP